MGLLITLVVIAVAAWFWRTRKYDKQTTLDFDTWVSKYDAASSRREKSGMAVAFVNQSINLAWTMGAINGKQREVVTKILKNQRATTTMVMWLGTSLSAVIRVVGQEELNNSPARSAGMLLLLSWMSTDNERENAVRQYLFRR